MARKQKEQVIGSESCIKEGIVELKKLHKYYFDEIKQNEIMIKHGRGVSPEEAQYYAGRAEAYVDHMAETSYIIDMLEGKKYDATQQD